MRTGSAVICSVALCGGLLVCDEETKEWEKKGRKGGTNWLLGADVRGFHGLRGHHLDGLGLLDFLGRHCDGNCV